MPAQITSLETPLILPAASHAAMTPEEAAKGYDTISMVFEKEMLFNAAWGTRVRYTKGIHEVPREWSEHWFFKCNEARVYHRQHVALDVKPNPKATR